MKTLNRSLGRMLITAMVAGLVAAAIGGVSLPGPVQETGR